MAGLAEAASVERSGLIGEMERARNMLRQLRDKLKQLNTHVSGPRPEQTENKAPKSIALSMEITFQEIMEVIGYCHEELALLEKSVGV